MPDLPQGTSEDAVVLSETFAAARELLRTAEADAARIRADAERYVRQREQEAELLIGKARRLLAMAEQRAVAIVAERERDRSAGGGTGGDDAVRTIDLDAAAEASPTADEPTAARHLRAPAPSGLDGILASAIARAVDRSFAADR